MTGMVRCPECGQWYFSHKKLSQHLIGKHDYEVVLDEEIKSTEKEVINVNT